jgi:hypothetical protein
VKSGGCAAGSSAQTGFCGRTVLVAGSPNGRHGVDVSDHLAAGVASLKARAAYLKGLGDSAMADPDEFLQEMSRTVGARLGVTFAVPFEVISFG